MSDPEEGRLRAERSPGLTLDILLIRLTANPRTRAVAFIGSTASGRGVSSGYDILVVLDQDPLVLRSGAVLVDGILADLLFATPHEIDSAVSLESTDLDSWDSRWVWWLKSASVAYDPDRSLGSAIRAATERALVVHNDRLDVRHRWDHANYNLIHNRRYASSPDPLYRDAFALRMTYSLADSMADYFVVRSIPWHGEKAALRYWDANDPQFRALFFSCLVEPDPVLRVEQYAELVRCTFEPVGDLWPSDGHSPGPASPADLDAATILWNELVGGGAET